jgi:hypothetical protein
MDDRPQANTSDFNFVANMKYPSIVHMQIFATSIDSASQ